MKIYRVSVQTPHEGWVLGWAGSRREAGATAREIREQYEVDADDPDLSIIEQVEIETDKAGLLAWLNAHFTRDNG